MSDLPDKGEGVHVADQSKQVRAPIRPFFPTFARAPAMAPRIMRRRNGSRKYKGAFDAGWDPLLREGRRLVKKNKNKKPPRFKIGISAPKGDQCCRLSRSGPFPRVEHVDQGIVF